MNEAEKFNYQDNPNSEEPNHEDTLYSYYL